MEGSPQNGFCGAGKKRMRSLGSVKVPTEAFLAVLKLDKSKKGRKRMLAVFFYASARVISSTPSSWSSQEQRSCLARGPSSVSRGNVKVYTGESSRAD